MLADRRADHQREFLGRIGEVFDNERPGDTQRRRTDNDEEIDKLALGIRAGTNDID